MLQRELFAITIGDTIEGLGVQIFCICEKEKNNCSRIEKNYLCPIVLAELIYLPSNKPSISNKQCVILLYTSSGILRFKSRIGAWRNLIFQVHSMRRWSTNSSEARKQWENSAAIQINCLIYDNKFFFCSQFFSDIWTYEIVLCRKMETKSFFPSEFFNKENGFIKYIFYERYKKKYKIWFNDKRKKK